MKLEFCFLALIAISVSEGKTLYGDEIDPISCVDDDSCLTISITVSIG